MDRNNFFIFKQKSLISLFFVSLFGISFETFLTRYFALVTFSEYSYWIISIAMLGYSVGGVLLALLSNYFYQKRAFFFFFVPPLLLVFSLFAFFILRINPFNPLKLQNEVLWKSQVAYIFLYYAGLFPVFFLTGIFIGLNFLTYYREIPKVYALDLLGSATGAAIILTAMFFIHPFHLLVVVLPLIFLIVILNTIEYKEKLGWFGSLSFIALCFIILCTTIYYILSISTLSSPEFKKLHSILNIKGSKVEKSILSPSGFYLIVDNYTEFDDVSMTNNYSFLHIGAPPRSYGIYKDGDRISSLIKEIPTKLTYIKGSLSYFPYTIRKNPSVLLIGTNGGFKIVERGRGVSSSGTALEKQRSIYRLIADSFGAKGFDRGATSHVKFLNSSVFSYLRKVKDKFDVIEIASDYLAQDDNNRYAFTLQAVTLYLRSLTPGGIISIPVDISEFSVYALKLINTIIAALSRSGIKNPSEYVMVYRSEWTCQILVSNRPFSTGDIKHLRKYCFDRSFDTSYYPGIIPSAVTIWNDLPPMSFQKETVQVSEAPQDALMDDLVRIFSNSRVSFYSSNFFNLSPSTIDKPEFYSVSRLSKLRMLLSRISIIPQQEIGYLINVVVLTEAILLAIVILLLPLTVVRKARQGYSFSASLFVRLILYFSALGLGFFFIELALIDKFSLFLDSATTSFGIILSGMLVFSGLGSWYSSRFKQQAYQGLLRALPIIIASLVFIALALDPLLMELIGLSLYIKIPITFLLIAPVSFALGRPFPLGNHSLGEYSGFFVPWAWAINGAFSVIATPLANIASNYSGWRILIAAAILIYASTIFTFPVKRKTGQ